MPLVEVRPLATQEIRSAQKASSVSNNIPPKFGDSPKGLEVSHLITSNSETTLGALDNVWFINHNKKHAGEMILTGRYHTSSFERTVHACEH